MASHRSVICTVAFIRGRGPGLYLLTFGCGQCQWQGYASGPFESGDYKAVVDHAALDRSVGDGGITEGLLASAEVQIHADAAAAARRGSVQDLKAGGGGGV